MLDRLAKCGTQPERKRQSQDLPNLYEFRLEGALDPKWAGWFDGLSMRSENEVTILEGWVPDQSALHGLLAIIRDLGLTLLAVVRIKDPAAGRAGPEVP